MTDNSTKKIVEKVSIFFDTDSQSIKNKKISKIEKSIVDSVIKSSLEEYADKQQKKYILNDLIDNHNLPNKDITRKFFT